MDKYCSGNPKKFVVIFLVIIQALLPGCSISQGEEQIVFYEGGYLEFNPATILEEINAPNATPFLVIDTPSLPRLYPYENGSWGFEEFYNITEAAHKFVWDESLLDWHLGGLQFMRGCEYFEGGFTQAIFTYFREVTLEEGDFRLVHDIAIRPNANYIEWKGDGRYPRTLNWGTIESDEMRVSVSRALEVAEDSGGRLAREAISNECAITILYYPRSANSGWNIRYISNEGTIFEALIDPTSGEVTIVVP